MATTFPPTHPPTMVSRNAPFSAPNAMPVSNAPAGTFVPGTKVQVGSHRVIIEKYLSEGGFAHVYVVRLPKAVDGNDVAVLKRVAVPDKDHLANMRTEVETMKRLKGHRHIVRYFDSHASQLKGGGYEVFLLMEFCSGGGLIDFMNTRLQNRLTEPEILHIFSDVAEGVACMHYLKPPLLHRDLKVENVLISASRSTKTFKLCDFGSAAQPRPAATNAAEGRLIEDDIQRHTTLQYRSPEMIDVYRKQPIDEKSDIWALGVLLYKLCYYTTPFEEVGQMAILNASFKYPAYPVFSDGLKLLISSMLREHPAKRPNIYQIMQQVCRMTGKEIPIRDIYTGRTDSEARRNQQLPPSPKDAAPSAGASVSSPPKQEKQTIPDITPMRRGRPTKPISHQNSARPSPSPLRMINSSDPFATLDGGKSDQVDEFSSRFPTLDQFSILHESRKNFDFDPSDSKAKDPNDVDLSRRVTNALADEAFVKSPPLEKDRSLPTDNKSSAKPPRLIPERKKSTEMRQFPAPAAPNQAVPRKPVMVSTGTMTSPPSPPPEKPINSIHRFPAIERRPQNQQWQAEKERSRFNTEESGLQRKSAFASDLKSRSTTGVGPRSPASSRPSLEGPRPSSLDLDIAGDSSLIRSRSANIRQRPLSVNLGPKKDLIRPQLDEVARRPSYTSGDDSSSALIGDTETNIPSDMDFLRAKEEEENERKRDKRLSGGSINLKRSSLPSISLSGTKNLLAGRFGEAFRKFESNSNEKGQRSRSPSPMRHPLTLAPIAGSEATETSNEDNAIDETEEVSPEVRRELERRRLSQEEKRVANAAAEYRQRLAQKGAGGVGGGQANRAVTIQNKVHSLLKENDRPATKTATGYGRFTDTGDAPQVRHFEAMKSPPAPVPAPSQERFIPPTVDSNGLRKVASDSQGPPSRTQPHLSSTGVSKIQSQTPMQPIGIPQNVPPKASGQPRPTAPPKPKTLRTGQQETAPKGNESAVGDEWEAQFTKRYPSLNKLEMVETEIGQGPKDISSSRVREEVNRKLPQRNLNILYIEAASDSNYKPSSAKSKIVESAHNYRVPLTFGCISPPPNEPIAYDASEGCQPPARRKGGPQSWRWATNTEEEEEEEKKHLIVVLKNESQRFKALLAKFNRDEFHPRRDRLVVVLKTGNGKVREYLRTVDEAERRISNVELEPFSHLVIEDKSTHQSRLGPARVDENLGFTLTDSQDKREAQTMAPMEKADVDDELKAVIQSLYDIQSITAGYLPNSQPQLESAFRTLTRNLSTLHDMTLPLDNPSSKSTSSIQARQIPDSILDYVDAGRNPDIYTREFVELDQRGNASLNGKMTAFRDFSRVLAEEIKQGIEGTAGEVDKILGTYGLLSGEGENGGVKAEASVEGAIASGSIDSAAAVGQQSNGAGPPAPAQAQISGNVNVEDTSSVMPMTATVAAASSGTKDGPRPGPDPGRPR